MSPANATQFLINSQAMVTIQAGDSVYVTSSIALGSNAGGGAGNLTLSLGYSTTANATPTLVGTPMTGLSVNKSDRVVFSLTTLVTGLPAGTYFFAMAGSSNNTWDLLGNGMTTALVIRP